MPYWKWWITEIARDRKDKEGVYMDKVILYFFPDVREIIINLRIEIPFEECFYKIKRCCEHYKGKLKTANILVYDENKKLMFEICGVEPKYEIIDKYKDLEPQVLDIFNQCFLNDPSIKDAKPPALEDLKNLNVIVEGYTEPSEFYYGPDFSEKCKFSEVLDVMKKMTEKYAKDFPKLAFYVDTTDGKHLFSNYHDKLDCIYLGRINELNLTKELVKEGIGVK